MTMKELIRSGREFLNGVNGMGATPGGNADVYQNKELEGKAICKTMKTKDGQNRFVRSGQRVAAIRLALESDFCQGSETAGGTWGTLASEE
jgi:hypothetical protein